MEGNKKSGFDHPSEVAQENADTASEIAKKAVDNISDGCWTAVALDKPCAIEHVKRAIQSAIDAAARVEPATAKDLEGGTK